VAFLVADDQTVVREGLVMLLGCRRALRWWPRRATATKPPSSRNGLDPTWSVGLRRARSRRAGQPDQRRHRRRDPAGNPHGLCGRSVARRLGPKGACLSERLAAVGLCRPRRRIGMDWPSVKPRCYARSALFEGQPARPLPIGGLRHQHGLTHWWSRVSPPAGAAGTRNQPHCLGGGGLPQPAV